MENQNLLSIINRARPDLQKVSGLDLIGALVDLFSLLYWTPFAIAGIIWLSTANSIPMLRTTWPILFLASPIGWAFRRLRFDIRLEIRPGAFTLAGGSFEMLVFWSLALLYGPAALWSAVLMALVDHIWQAMTRQATRWYRWRRLAADLATTSLVGQLALLLFRALGGQAIAFADTSAQTFLVPMLVATLTWFVLPRLIGLPLLIYVSRSPSITGADSLADQSTMARFLLIGNSISGIGDLFAMLAALIFSQQNTLTYFLFLAGALLAALLANRLSQMAALGRRKARELEILERMSRSILGAPELEVAALGEILAQHANSLFPKCRAEVRLSSGLLVFRQTPEWFSSNRPLWQRLIDRANASRLRPSELPQGNPSQSPWVALAVPIPPQQAENPLGAAALLSELDARCLDAYRPALLAFAELIASALQRIQLQKQALEEQAKVYQREVYAQAYQAEVYAQALSLEKLTQELVVAGQIQLSFLPESVPDLPGWQLSVALEPAREASGDYYDFIQLPNDKIGLVIADVAEKGMGAALYMALSRTLIRTYALEFDTAPQRALQAANRRILEDTHSDLFVTVFYAILDLASGQLTYCNAGHNPPLLLQSGNGGMPQPLLRTALPLGIIDEPEWECAQVQLQPGDVLTMYTDGVTEAQNESHSFFGEDRLKALLSANANRAADVIEDKIISAIYDFAGDAPQFDDIALMILIRET